MKRHKNSLKGFTLIELTIVCAIIGILAAIAIPDFNKFTAKSRQSEAKGMLPLIASYQYDYKLRHGAFIACPLNPPEPDGTWNPDARGWKELGFEPVGRHYYSYEVELTENNFIVRAVGNIDREPLNDVWILHGSSLCMINEVNDVSMD